MHGFFCSSPSFENTMALCVQDGVRIHTISRSTGQARVWQLPLAFCAYVGNAYDTEGGSALKYGARKLCRRDKCEVRTYLNAARGRRQPCMATLTVFCIAYSPLTLIYLHILNSTGCPSCVHVCVR